VKESTSNFDLDRAIDAIRTVARALE